ncbi:hypothetical protein PO909_018600 [Leuciscus waleckii]
MTLFSHYTHAYTHIQPFGSQTLFLHLEQTLKASLMGLQAAFHPIAAHRLIRMWHLLSGVDVMLTAAFKETLPLTNVSYVLKSQMKGKGEGECGRKRRETSRFIFMCLRRCKDSPEHKGSHYCLPFVEFSGARKLTDCKHKDMYLGQAFAAGSDCVLLAGVVTSFVQFKSVLMVSERQLRDWVLCPQCLPGIQSPQHCLASLPPFQLRSPSCH